MTKSLTENLPFQLKTKHLLFLSMEEISANPDLVTKKIIFFDGVCVLCNSFVDEVLRRDSKQVFYLSPLQGETAQKLLTTEQRKLDSKGDPTSVLYYRAGKVCYKSDAVIKILKDLEGNQPAIWALSLFPTKLRDTVYGLTAKYRYKIFGKKDTCRVPTPEQRKQFLP